MEYNGYTYGNNGKRKGITYYKCAKSNNVMACPGTAKKNVDGSIIELKPHLNHLRSVNNRNIIKIFRNSLKNRAKNENISLKRIYDEEAQRHITAAALYPWTTAECIMRYSRQSSLPTLPQSLQDLALKFDNEELNRYSCCDTVIFQGCVTDNDGKVSVILACRQLIRVVMDNNITEIHADATFKVVPANMGYQLLTLHCMIENYSIPIVYALMEAKTRNSYQCVINYMKINLFPEFQPLLIITDYESALRDALFNFGTEETRTVGCWFHHNQAVWKKMKSMQYLDLVNQNDFALKSLKMLMCLPLLPAEKMEQGFLLIKAFAINHNLQMNDFFNYYQRFWLQRVGPNIVSVNGIPRRTNNNIESFHNNLRYAFSVTHPNLWVFLGQLCDLNKKYHLVVTQLANGLQPTRNLKSKYLINSRRIKTASEQLSSGTINVWNFLIKCSFSCSSYEQRQRLWELNRDPQDNDHEILNDANEYEEEDSLEEPINVANETSSTTCMTCMVTMSGVNVIQYIVLPCGHAWVCETCVVNLNEQYPKRCPMCRADVDVYRRIFYS